MSNPMENINRMITESNEVVNNARRQIADDKAMEIERKEKSNELLEASVSQNEEMIKLQKAEVDFLKSIDGNTATLLRLIGDLEKTNQAMGSITTENMLQIQQKLDEIIGSSESVNVSELLLEEAKKQIIEKGVDFGVQFIIMGLKLLFKAKVVE